MIHHHRTDLLGQLSCSASFSECERYRYSLTWRWDERALLVAWMLNPSTATHEKLDPTISGMVKRARAWDYGGVSVINLFALRATDPRVMLAASDPIGLENDAATRYALDMAAAMGDTVMAGWGAHGGHMERDRWAVEAAREAGVELYCLAVNAGGSPKHPLYVAHAVTLTNFPVDKPASR